MGEWEPVPRSGTQDPTELERRSVSSWLYVLVAVTLSLALLAGGVAWVLLAFADKQMPDGLAAVLATIAGGLVGILTPGGPSGRARTGPAQDQTPPQQTGRSP
ncbi:MAG: hypothetical protein M3N52_02180 [Actinomycetota bacterium]|nr:hypothetical protein [Actinomycetota bacterium]